MSPRTLWAIILKIFGIYFFFQCLYLIQAFLTSVSVFPRDNNFDIFIAFIAVSLLIIGAFLLILYTLIFKTDWLIDTFRLSKGITDERLELNIGGPVVLRMIIIVTGAFVLVDDLPLFLKQLFECFKEAKVSDGLSKSPSFPWVTYYLLKMSLAFFMISSSRLIVNFIERKRKDKVKVAE
jgi:hypothetical protein